MSHTHCLGHEWRGPVIFQFPGWFCQNVIFYYLTSHYKCINRLSTHPSQIMSSSQHYTLHWWHRRNFLWNITHLPEDYPRISHNITQIGKWVHHFYIMALWNCSPANEQRKLVIQDGHNKRHGMCLPMQLSILCHDEVIYQTINILTYCITSSRVGQSDFLLMAY